MPYQLEGQLLEVCSCNVSCPCWLGQDPDGGTCDGTLVWHIEKGNINGVDVSGRTIAVIVHVPGNILKGGMRAAVYLDDGINDAQQEALLQVYTGQLGGPVAQLAALIGEVVGVQRVPITADAKNGKGTLRIGNDLSADIEPIMGAFGKPAEVNNAVFSSIPNSPTYVATSPNFQIKQQALGIELQLKGHSAMNGAFRFEG